MKLYCLLLFFVSLPALSQQKTCYSLFEEARQIVQKAGIKTLSEYQDRYKELQELGLPRSPSIFYKKDGWLGWKDFLGENFQTYKEIQEIAQKAGIKTEAEYKKVYSKLGLPSYPDIIYEEEWPGWKKFLVREKKKRAQNTRRFLGVRRNLPNFEKAKEIAQGAGIKTHREYKKAYIELGLSSSPNITYKGQGWKGWGDFLGTGRVMGKNFPSYEEAKQIAQEAGIKTVLEYREVYRSLGLPSAPYMIYKAQGWKGWKPFLGTNPLNFEEAQALVQKAGIKKSLEYQKRYKELGLPANPNITYKGQGWKGWGDFLGTNSK